MELKVFRDTLSAAGSFCSVQAEIPMETEILISDYLPQVFKIVKCFVKLVVLQKQLQQGRLTLDGYLRCIVYYQGEDGSGLCQTEQKIPFTKAIETPQFEYSIWSASIGGETEYLNCRAVNQRRVEVRGAYAISACIFTQVQKEIVSTVAEGGVQQKPMRLRGVRNLANLDKLITTEGEFAFDEAPTAVLDITGEAVVREVKVIAGKAVVKGEIETALAYRSAAGEGLRGQMVQVPFQQIVDVDGLAEDCACLCTVEPVGFTLTGAGGGEESEQSQIAASALLHLRVYRGYELNGVADLFSTTHETEVGYETLTVESFEKALDDVITVNATAQLPDENAQLMAAFGSLSMAEVLPAGDKAVLHAKGIVTVFCKNSLDEIESHDKVVELNWPLATAATSDQLHLESWLSIEQLDCTYHAGQLEMTLGVRVRGVLLSRAGVMSAAEVHLGEALQPQDPDVSLRIYYANAGEGVFEIARRFHVSPSDMMQANALELETLTAARRLLVPGVG